ncbi:hypothetical protein I5M32_11785 [Pedobacter sp. SD-b]|uniref:Uncharacterized protein n=1 Tax=Pedobacter segetis TaxID=2793069 RepID=A0ABS1BL72_9SPHI|nr:hypothetical protein [Pedobacter segetis]MBK0383639.1 hypothetical protein [Pedobacter segetis]
MAELYKQVIFDALGNDRKNFEEKRRKLIADISGQNNSLTNIRALLLSNDIDIEDYKIMKSKCEDKIDRLEAQLKELKTWLVLKVI